MGTSNGQLQNVASISDEEKQSTLRKVVFSSFLGNFIEWFDYGSYSCFAAVIGAVFFPADDPLITTVNAFAVFVLGVLARPLGALFWGNMGDKEGRKWTLSVTILIVSGATFLIGCLPCCEIIGIGAVVLLLLLRMTQSFSVSGEYAGASTFIAEYAPAKHRGFYVSMVPASTATGLPAATVFATVMFTTFGADSAFVHDWGWRIPFLLALPLDYITHWIRTHLSDSPVCEVTMDAVEHGGEKAEKQPVRDLFRHHLRPTLIAFGTCVLKAVGFYAVFTFMPACLTDVLECDAGQATLITNILLVAYILLIFASGCISDKVGRKKMIIIAAAGFVILTVPMFLLVGTMSFGLILVAELVMNALLTINGGTQASYSTEAFPTEVRLTGFAFTFSSVNALFGGSCSFISLWLVNQTGSNLAQAFYIMAIAVIVLICMILSHESSNGELGHIE